MTMLLITAAVLAPNTHKATGEINTRWCSPSHCLTAPARHRYRVAIRGYRPWLRSVRMCESGGNYQSNGQFSGAYQFLPSTWRSIGGRGMPHEAAPLEQDYFAVRLRQRDGTSPWPRCGA